MKSPSPAGISCSAPPHSLPVARWCRRRLRPARGASRPPSRSRQLRRPRHGLEGAAARGLLGVAGVHRRSSSPISMPSTPSKTPARENPRAGGGEGTADSSGHLERLPDLEGVQAESRHGRRAPRARHSRRESLGSPVIRVVLGTWEDRLTDGGIDRHIESLLACAAGSDRERSMPVSRSQSRIMPATCTPRSWRASSRRPAPTTSA